jgi:hypothetical protein
VFVVCVDFVGLFEGVTEIFKLKSFSEVLWGKWNSVTEPIGKFPITPWIGIRISEQHFCTRAMIWAKCRYKYCIILFALETVHNKCTRALVHYASAPFRNTETTNMCNFALFGIWTWVLWVSSQQCSYWKEGNLTF